MSAGPNQLYYANTFVNPPTASSLRTPIAVVADAAGRLWVSDQDDNRVLRFDNAAAKANGAPADGVLGQPNFTSNTLNPPSAVSLNLPQGIFVDSSGRLWVLNSVTTASCALIMRRQGQWRACRRRTRPAISPALVVPLQIKDD
ncbi:MAG: hypothetical protein U0Y68_12150 [Blastocatellia bacterium]